MVDVSEKMIEAGRSVLDDYFGNDGYSLSDAHVAALYTAMHSAREVDEALVGRVAKAIYGDNELWITGSDQHLRLMRATARRAIAAMGEGDVR